MISGVFQRSLGLLAFVTVLYPPNFPILTAGETKPPLCMEALIVESGDFILTGVFVLVLGDLGV